MDWEKIWSDFLGAVPRDLEDAGELGAAMLANPVSRAALLILLVYATIRVIASVYSGDKQGAELGPVAVRPHTSTKHGRNTVRLPHELMPMSMDGVSAHCRIFYVYNDARGRRRKQLVHTIKNAQLSVSPVRLPRVRDVIYGQEIPDDVATRHVCFPSLDMQEPADPVPPTPELAKDYAGLHRILESWTEDDSAAWVSTSGEVQDEIASGKTAFIKDRAARLAKAEQGFFNKMHFRRLHANRPNAVGSYYLKFEFSHEPLFVLTRHPDRDLKMTAWLTILTSMFALIMDWWPNGEAPFGIVAPAEASQPADRAPARVVRVP